MFKVEQDQVNRPGKGFTAQNVTFCLPEKYCRTVN